MCSYSINHVACHKCYLPNIPRVPSLKRVQEIKECKSHSIHKVAPTLCTSQRCSASCQSIVLSTQTSSLEPCPSRSPSCPSIIQRSVARFGNTVLALQRPCSSTAATPSICYRPEVPLVQADSACSVELSRVWKDVSSGACPAESNL